MRTLSVILAIFLSLGLVPQGAGQSAFVRPADYMEMPGAVDSNSPVHWVNRNLYVYNSMGMPLVSRGRDLTRLGPPRAVVLNHRQHTPLWIESTWGDRDGTVYAWYHHEPPGVCPGSRLTAPKIGALISGDGGITFYDLGFVLQSGDRPNCAAQNGYFAGGHGDFSVILDQEQTYFYFLFGNYGGFPAGQGVAVARMKFQDRWNPAGKVWKFFNGQWTEPGIGGRVTPIFPVNVGWGREETDAFWGPSLHWNRYLGQHVMLLNRACCEPGWPQEGIYVSFSRELSNPNGWTVPLKILDGGNWYPQVVGMNPGETDKLAGQTARLFVHGYSEWEIVFYREDIQDPVSDQVLQIQEQSVVEVQDAGQGETVSGRSRWRRLAR